MEFLDKLHYKVGSQFNENNIELELKSKSDSGKMKFYNSYKNSEIHLFGKTFDFICSIVYLDNKLFRLAYYFDIKFLNLFIESINKELPKDQQLTTDHNNNLPALETFFNGVAIGIVLINKNNFRLYVCKNPSLPRITCNK